MPKTRFNLEFEIINEKSETICSAISTLVFADAATRKPKRLPKIIEIAFINHFKSFVR